PGIRLIGNRPASISGATCSTTTRARSALGARRRGAGPDARAWGGIVLPLLRSFGRSSAPRRPARVDLRCPCTGTQGTLRSHERRCQRSTLVVEYRRARAAHRRPPLPGAPVRGPDARPSLARGGTHGGE